MLKALPITAIALGLSGGVAFADHDHRNDHRGTVTVRDHRGGYVAQNHGDWHRGNVVRDRGWRGGGTVVVRDRGYYGGRAYVRPTYNYSHVRRPIYVSRPIIRHRYFNYYQRPALIIENYNTMAGYYWVRGQWTWDGYEWIWQPGHYEPDPNYGYYDSY